MNDQSQNTKEKIINLLAEHIGVDKEDISLEDTFTEDLHMSASDLIDFSQKLKEAGIDISQVDFTEIKDVESLVENIISQEELK